MNNPVKRFYVYTLTDPHDKIFYVGKGCGQRVFDHEKEARRGCECHKCRKIRKIWRNGGQIHKYYVFETDDEEAAYKHEEDLIADIGMKNLCNKRIGGRGNRSISNEEIERIKINIVIIERAKEQERLRREEYADRYYDMLERQRIARATRRQAEKLQTKTGGLPPGCVVIHPVRKRRKK